VARSLGIKPNGKSARFDLAQACGAGLGSNCRSGSSDRNEMATNESERGGMRRPARHQFWREVTAGFS
jgi:hypothetical protein